jgi:tetratricopeptide (TPR) repeat protein
MDQQIRAHLETLEAAPGDAEAFRALEEAYRSGGRFEELASLLEARARVLPTAEAGRLLAQAAEVARREAANPGRAEELYRALLAHDPINQAALQALAELAEARQDWATLAEVLERQALATPTPADGARLSLRLGKLHEEKLGRRDRAALRYAGAVRLDAGLAEARQRGLDACLALRRYTQAKRLLDTARDGGAERAGLARDYARLGATLADQALFHDVAMDSLIEAQMLDRAAPGAAEARERLTVLPRRWREEAAELEARAGRSPRREAAELLLRAAQLQAAYSPDGVAPAVELLERAWVQAPGHPAVLELLEKVLEDRKDFGGHAAALERLALATRERGALVQLLLASARLKLVRLGDAPAALATLARALEYDPACEPAALQSFEQLADAGRFAEAVAVLERHLEATPEKPGHALLRVRAAELCRTRLDDAERARRHLDAALRADPGNAAAAAALVPLLTAGGEWARLVEVLAVRVASEPDTTERVRLQERQAAVELEQLERPGDAFRTLSRALALDPRRGSIRAALEEAARRAGLLPELCRALRSAARAVALDPAARRSLLRRAGELLDGELGQPEAGAEAWRELVGFDPGDREAAAALADCEARARAQAEALDKLAADHAQARGPRRRETGYALARALSVAGRGTAAAVTWRELLAASVDDEEALWGLHGALEATPGPVAAEERTQVLARLAALVRGAPERVELELERAVLLVEPLGRHGEAAGVVTALLAAGGTTAAQQQQAVALLERLLTRGVDPLRIARVLAPVHAARGEPGKQVAMLELVARRLPADADPRERARYLLDASVIRGERLGDVRGALTAAAEALRAAPNHTEARKRCEQLAHQVGAQAELYALLVEAARRLEGKPDEEVALRRRAAAVAEEELGASDAAAEQLRRCLELRPADPELMARLTRVLLVAECWGEAVELLVERARGAVNADRSALLGQLAEVLLERLDRTADAVAAYREALALAAPAGRGRLLSRLAVALGAAGDPAGQASTLAELAAATEDPAEAARASLESARLSAGLGDQAGAVSRLAGVLRADPSDVAALAALEQALVDPQPEVVLTAAGALEAAHATRGDAAGRLRALTAAARVQPEAEPRAAAWRQVARLHEQAGTSPVEMVAAAVEAVRATPAAAELRRELRRVADLGRDVEAAARGLDEAAEALGGAERATVLRELADWCERRMEARDRAAEAWERLLLVTPGDAAALAALRRLFRATEQWSRLVEVCEVIAAHAASSPARQDPLREIAALAESRLGDLPRAVDAWREVARLSPEDRDVAAAVDRLLTTLDRPAELAAALEARLEGAFDPETAFRLAELRRTRLEDPAGALALHADLARREPGRSGPREALVLLAALPGVVGQEALVVADTALRAAGEQVRRVAIREARLAGPAEPAERARLHAEIRALLERELGDAGAARAAARRAFAEGGPGREDAEADLRRLAAAGGAGAFAVVADAYLEAAGEGGEGALDWMRKAARVRDVELDDGPGAILVWKSVLEAQPEDAEALEVLERRYAEVTAFREQLEMALRRATLAVGDARVPALRHAAEIARQAGDADAEISSLAEARLVAPRDEATLAALEEALARAGRASAQVEVLQAMAELAGDRDPAERLALLSRRAELLERDPDPHRAIDAYTAVLAEWPRDPIAVAGLERLLERPDARAQAQRILEDVQRLAGDPSRLATLLEIRLEATPASHRQGLLAEIAGLRERGGNREAAFATRLRAFEEAVAAGGDDPAGRADLERLAGDAAAWEAVAGAYQAALSQVPAAALELRRRLASICGERLGALDRAVAWWEEVAAADPGPEPLSALVRLRRRQGAKRELVAALLRLAEATPAPESKKELLFEVAKIMDEQLANRDGAIEAYRKILSIDPEDPGALRLLGRLLNVAERWEELAAVMEREAVAAARRPETTAEAAELRFRLGRIRQARLNDAAGALAAYRQVLERAPRHPGTLAALQELARTSGPAAMDASFLLEPIYVAENEHARLIEVLESRVQNEPSPSARSTLLRRISTLYGTQVRNGELAFTAAGRALTADPDSVEALQLAVTFGQQIGLPEQVQLLLTENADRAHEPAARVEYQRQLARLESDPARAAEAWQRLLELAPEDREASAGLLDTLRGSPDAEALEKALRRALALEEQPGQRQVLLADLAMLQEERLGDPAGAAATLKRLLELAPGSREAMARLDRLHVAGERWVELGDLLDRELAAARQAGDAPAVLVLCQRLGELKETRLLDREGAMALYEEVLAARPDSPETLARLGAMLEKDPGNDRAALALETAYAAAGDHRQQAMALEVRAQGRPDPQERKALWLRLAELRAGPLAEPELAFVALSRAFRDDPGDEALRSSVEALATRTGQFEELAALYEDEVDKLQPAPMAAVALVLGRLYEEKLDGPPAAAQWYQRARALDPNAAPVALPALERLHQRLEAWTELAEVLQARALEAIGGERVPFLYRLGRLCEERLAAPDQAAHAYEQALAVDPRHLPSLQALEALYEAAGRKAELVANLAAQRAVVNDGATRERLLAKQATLSAELGQVEEAVELWREVLGLRARHEEALASLEELLQQLERWSELAAHLRVCIGATVDRREVARLNDKLGWLMGVKLGDPAQAIQSYKAVLASDSSNKRALESLRDIYAAQGDLEGLAGTLRQLIPRQEDPAGVKRIRLDLAEVLARAGQKLGAVEQAKLAFGIEPHTVEQLVRIEEVFRAAGAAADAIRAAEARAAVLAESGGPAEAIPAWLAVAELWNVQKRPDAAAAALDKVLALDSGNRPAFLALRGLHQAAANWRADADLCLLFAPQAGPEERLALLKEVAVLREQRLGEKHMASLAWNRVLGEAPGDEQALAECWRLAHEGKEQDTLAVVIEDAADKARGMVRARLLLKLGALLDAPPLDDAEGAENAIRRALEADPANPDALDALAGLFKRRGRIHELVITIEQKLEGAAGLDEKKALLLEVSRLYDEVIHDVDEAVAALKRLLELDGGDPAALEALAGLLRREHRWGELAGVLARARDLANDDAARLGWQLQIAGLNENEIGDEEAAVEDYRTVLGLDDRNPTALAGLERLYTKLDRFAELNRVYERQVELSGDPVEQVRILARSAGIFEEKMHDAARATAQNEAILRVDGGNVPAIKALERLYRDQGLFDRLLTVLAHHLGLLTDRKEQVALMVIIGDVWWKEMSRVDRAEAIFNQAIQLDPESRQAVAALGRLYERSGNWNLALEMLQREGRIAGASRDAVDIYLRIGAIDQDMLMDTAAAKEAFGKCLALDPGCLPALRAMRGIAEREGNRDAFLELLTAEARYAEDDEQRADRWTEVGKIFQEERDDREGAVRAYEEALKRKADHLPSARPLSDLYVALQRWPDAARVLEAIVRTLEGGGDAKELCRQCYRQGYVAEKLGQRPQALQSYRRAYELDATYLPALEGLGNLLVAEGQLEEALRIFTAIIIHHRDQLTDLEVVETHWQIGEVADRLQQPDRAVGSFKKALELDGGHEPSRRSLVRLLEAAGDWDGAVEQRQRLLPSLEGRARFEAHVAIGQACRDHLKDPYQAIDAFTGASRIDPTDLPVTEALLALYRETRQGQKAADVLAQIIARPEVQADAPRAAKLHVLLAEILRDEVKDEAGALAQFEKALDLNPRQPQAFAWIEQVLGRGKRWAELEQAYLRMVQRLPKSAEAAPARLALWKTLGDLYRNVLKSDDGARMAYQVVSRADPEDAVAVELYADLSARTPGQEAEAMLAYRQLLKLGAKPQKALSALVSLHATRKQFDRAYSAAQVLVHLTGQATPEDVAVVARLRKFARDQASRPLDDELWGLLFHERLRGPLAEIMALLSQHARPMFVQSPKELGLNLKKDELDVQGSMLFLVNMFKYVARTLGVEPLRLFRREEVASRLQLVPTDPPGVLVAEELFSDRPKKELWFALGKALAFRRPELYMARLMPHDQLDLVFQAACSVGTSRFVVTADPHLVAKLKTELEKVLPEKIRTNTLKLLSRQYCDVQHPGDVRAYLDGAELTSNRVGALLAADLETVKRGVLGEKAQVSKLRDETKVKDLSNYCISEEYAVLREQLGLAAVTPA